MKKPMKIDWKTLSVGQLREEKNKVLAWLDTANHDLQIARRNGAQGNYLPAEEYDALIDRRTRLVRTVRGLTLELQKRREESQDSYNAAFYRAADELLDDETFNEVQDRAEEILHESTRTEQSVRGNHSGRSAAGADGA